MAITLSVLLASTTGWLGFLVVHHSGTSGLLGSADWSGGESVGASTGVGVGIGLGLCGAFAAGAFCTICMLRACGSSPERKLLVVPVDNSPRKPPHTADGVCAVAPPRVPPHQPPMAGAVVLDAGPRLHRTAQQPPDLYRGASAAASSESLNSSPQLPTPRLSAAPPAAGPGAAKPRFFERPSGGASKASPDGTGPTAAAAVRAAAGPPPPPTLTPENMTPAHTLLWRDDHHPEAGQSACVGAAGEPEWPAEAPFGAAGGPRASSGRAPAAGGEPGWPAHAPFGGTGAAEDGVPSRSPVAGERLLSSLARREVAAHEPAAQARAQAAPGAARAPLAPPRLVVGDEAPELPAAVANALLRVGMCKGGRPSGTGSGAAGVGGRANVRLPSLGHVTSATNVEVAGCGVPVGTMLHSQSVSRKDPRDC